MKMTFKLAICVVALLVLFSSANKEKDSSAPADKRPADQNNPDSASDRNSRDQNRAGDQRKPGFDSADNKTADQNNPGSTSGNRDSRDQPKPASSLGDNNTRDQRRPPASASRDTNSGRDQSKPGVSSRDSKTADQNNPGSASANRDSQDRNNLANSSRDNKTADQRNPGSASGGRDNEDQTKYASSSGGNDSGGQRRPPGSTSGDKNSEDKSKPGGSSRDNKTADQKKPDAKTNDHNKGGHQKTGGRTDDKKRSPATCETPVEASRDTCKKENRSKLTAACNHDLIKKCVKNNFQDCSDVPQASTQACKPTVIKQYLNKKPECYTKATTQCREFLSSDANKANVKQVIPENCKSWFDGCNDCKVKDGKADGCTKKICRKKDLAFCKHFQDGKQCKKSRATGKATCDGDEKASKTTASESPCEDIISDFKLSREEVCKKALYKCTDNPAVVESCKIQRRQDEVADCSSTKDKAKQRSCCVQDKLSGSKCDTYGSAKTLPSDCKSRCVAEGKFKSKEKSCRSCRGIGDIRLKGVADDGKGKKGFDPARVETSIKEVASRLNKGGQQCIKRIANAMSLLQTQIQQWSKDPSQAEEISEEVELKSIANIQNEIDKTVDSSKLLEHEFQADTDGENYRRDTNASLLQISDESKPKICAAEFTALQKAYNKIATNYTNLPNELKNDGVERVEFGFEETDIGSTDLEDSKSICTFAKTFVKSVKKAEGFHKKRLRAARNLICVKAGAMLKSKLTSKLVNCLIKAKSDVDQGNNATKKTDFQNDIDKFNKNGLKRISKLFLMMKNKCLMKDTADSEAARVDGVFKSKLKATIKKKAGEALTQDEMQSIADTISDAVILKFPNAKNIATSFVNVSRRQLRPRRALESVFEAETTYDLDTPGPVGETIISPVTGTDIAIEATEVELGSTNAVIEVTKEIQEINAELPSGDAESNVTTMINEMLDDANATVTSTTTESGGSTNTSADSNLIVYILVVVIPIVLLIVTLVIAWFCYNHYKRVKKKEANKENEKFQDIVTATLVEAPYMKSDSNATDGTTILASKPTLASIGNVGPKRQQKKKKITGGNQSLTKIAPTKIAPVNTTNKSRM